MLFVLSSNEFKQLSPNAQGEIINILSRKKTAEIEAAHLDDFTKGLSSRAFKCLKLFAIQELVSPDELIKAAGYQDRRSLKALIAAYTKRARTVLMDDTANFLRWKKTGPSTYDGFYFVPKKTHEALKKYFQN